MKLTEKVKVFAMAGILALAGVVAVLPVTGAYADFSEGLTGGASEAGNGNGLAKDADLPSVVTTVINIILYAVGVIAVVMMIFGGFQYITSSGDTAKVTKAKNTILYGIIGLVVAILAYAIVNFVITNIGS